MSTWILCPNLWGARLFRYGGARLSRDGYLSGPLRLEFIREFPRPATQTRLEDFPTEDEFEQKLQPPEDPAIEERVARSYMSYLGSELEQGARQEQFDSLILCAESHLLKILKSHLGPSSRNLLRGSVNFDLYETNESDLLPFVQDILSKTQTSKPIKKGAA